MLDALSTEFPPLVLSITLVTQNYFYMKLYSSSKSYYLRQSRRNQGQHSFPCEPPELIRDTIIERLCLSFVLFGDQ